MDKRILDFFVVPSKSENEQTLISNWLRSVLLTALGILICYALIMLFLRPDPMVYIVIGIFLLVLVGLLALLQKGHASLVSILLSLSGMGGLLFAAYRFGGVRSPSYNALIIVIILAAMFLRGRMVVFAAGISMLAGFFLMLAEVQETYKPDGSFLTPPMSWLASIMTFIIAAVLLGIASRQIRDALLRAAREIDERRRVENALREKTRVQAALHETTLDIINRLELLPLLDSVLTRAQDLVDTEHGYVDMLMPGSKGFQQMVGYGVFEQFNGAVVLLGQGLSGLVLATGQTQVIDNYQTWPQHVPAYARGGIQTIAAVPLKVEGQVVGIIGLAHTDPARKFSPAQMEILDQFARLAALALENARLYQAAQDELAERKRTEAALLLADENLHLALESAHMGTWEWNLASNAVAWSDNIYPIFDITKEQFEKKYNRYFDLIHPDDQEKIQAEINKSLANPEADYSVEHRIVWPDGSLHWLEEKGKVYVDESGQPARMAGTVTDISDRKAAEESLRWANTQLQRDTVMLERRSTLLQVAAEVSRAASAILDPSALSQKAVNLVRNRFGLYYVGLFLVDENNEFAVLNAASGEAKQTLLKSGFKLPIGNTSMIGWCITNRRPRIALDVGAEATRFNNPLLPKTRSELAMPLITRGQTIGAVTIQSTEESAFSLEDIATFQTLADQLANAIMNARLYEQLQHELEERKRAEEEVRLLNAELEQRVQARTADLRRSEETCRALTENNPLEITRYDQDGHYLYANRTSGGLPPEDIIGKTIREITRNPLAADVAEACIQKVFKTGEPLKIDYDSEDGKAVTWWLAPEFDLDGNVTSVIATTIDITERVRMEAELRQRSAELETTNKELEAFSYSVSHDLRAPLRAIDGFSRILMEDFRASLPSEAGPFLSRISTASHQMGQLIDDLLRLSRITRLELHENTVDLSALVKLILDEIKDREPERKVDIQIEDGLTTSGDERLLRVALENLLNNAWKFTGKVEQARIQVGKTVHKGEPAFYIKDNGVGFDMQYINKLFGAFQRLHSTEEFPGTGIGLAIVQRVIHKHGGRVWAEAEKGKGATFYFTL